MILSEPVCSSPFYLPTMTRTKTPYLPTYCGRQSPGSVPHLPTYLFHKTLSPIPREENSNSYSQAAQRTKRKNTC